MAAMISMVGKNPTQHFLSYDLLESRRIDGVTMKNFASLLYETNRFHVTEGLYSNASQNTSNCGRNPVTHSSAPRGPHFCSYYKFDVKKRNLFVNSILLGGESLCVSKVFSLKKQLCHLNEALNWNSQ